MHSCRHSSLPVDTVLSLEVLRRCAVWDVCFFNHGPRSVLNESWQSGFDIWQVSLRRAPYKCCWALPVCLCQCLCVCVCVCVCVYELVCSHVLLCLVLLFWYLVGVYASHVGIGMNEYMHLGTCGSMARGWVGRAQFCWPLNRLTIGTLVWILWTN